MVEEPKASIFFVCWFATILLSVGGEINLIFCWMEEKDSCRKSEKLGI